MQRHAKNIVILISGSGSNMLAVVHAARRENWLQKLGAGVVCVLSNRPDAEGLQAASDTGVPTDVVDHRQFE